MIFVKSIFVAFLFFILSGCVVEQTPTKSGYVLDKSLPAWLLNPDMDGNFGAVGFVKDYSKNPPQKKELAIILAKKNLSKKIEINIKSKIEIDKNQNSSNIYSLSKQDSQAIIKNSYIKDHWLDKNSDEFYIWLVIKEE